MNCARCGLRASAVGISDGRATEDSFVLLDIGDISRLIDFVLGIAARAKPANQPTQHAVTTRSADALARTGLRRQHGRAAQPITSTVVLGRCFGGFTSFSNKRPTTATAGRQMKGEPPREEQEGWVHAEAALFLPGVSAAFRTTLGMIRSASASGKGSGRGRRGGVQQVRNCSGGGLHVSLATGGAFESALKTCEATPSRVTRNIVMNRSRCPIAMCRVRDSRAYCGRLDIERNDEAMTNEEHCVEWLAQDDAVQPILSRCFADNGGVCDISWCVGWVGVDAARAEPPGRVSPTGRGLLMQ